MDGYDFDETGNISRTDLERIRKYIIDIARAKQDKNQETEVQHGTQDFYFQEFLNEFNAERNPKNKVTNLGNEQFNKQLNKNICSIILNPQEIYNISDFDALLDFIKEIKGKNFKNFNDHYNQNIQEVLDNFLNTNNPNVTSDMIGKLLDETKELSGEQFKKLVTFLDKEPNENLKKEIFSKLANKKISKAEISLDGLKNTTIDLISAHILPKDINLDEKIKNGTAVSCADYIAMDQFKVTFKNPEIIKGTSFEKFQTQYNDKSNKKEIAVECAKFQKDIKTIKLKGRDINIKDIETIMNKSLDDKPKYPMLKGLFNQVDKEKLIKSINEQIKQDKENFEKSHWPITKKILKIFGVEKKIINKVIERSLEKEVIKSKSFVSKIKEERRGRERQI